MIPAKVQEVIEALNSCKASDCGELLAVYKLLKMIDSHEIMTLAEVRKHLAGEQSRIMRDLGRWPTHVGHDGIQYSIIPEGNDGKR